jgi:hypothetical protein
LQRHGLCKTTAKACGTARDPWAVQNGKRFTAGESAIKIGSYHHWPPTAAGPYCHVAVS